MIIKLSLIEIKYWIEASGRNNIIILQFGILGR